MTFTKVMATLNLRFISGNSAPVQSARITKEEWDVIKEEIDRLDVDSRIEEVGE